MKKRSIFGSVRYGMVNRARIGSSDVTCRLILLRDNALLHITTDI